MLASDVRNVEYALLALPFQLHGGWIVSATNLNLNLLFVYLSPDNSSMQISIAALSVSAIILSCMCSIFVVKPIPAYTIALVGVWTFMAIADQLSSPPEKIESRFDSATLAGFRGASQIGGYGVLAIAALKFVYRLVRPSLVERGGYKEGEAGDAEERISSLTDNLCQESASPPKSSVVLV